LRRASIAAGFLPSVSASTPGHHKPTSAESVRGARQWIAEQVMNVILRPEQERVVGEAISAGLIGTPDEVVDLGVETIRRRLESRSTHSRQHEIDSAAERLRNFGEKYHFSLGGLTIRDLVNEGRR
jgi:hypothetical protein